MMVREPIVAGRFYPANEAECRSQLEACIAEARRPENLPAVVLGGLVPHAGWMCSGRVAGGVFAAIAAAKPETLVMFGAVHHRCGWRATMFAAGQWQTPLGPVEIDRRLAERLAGHTSEIDSNPHVHEQEHSLEVQMPFLRMLLPDVKVLPIMVPPEANAVEVGSAVAGTLRAYRLSAAVLGTTDLTHYGAGYGFEPHGRGAPGRHWAKDSNDKRMIDLILRLEADQVIPEAATHRNACGSGAIAATLSAARALGATRSVLVEHTTSFEVLGGQFSDDAVGYAGVVFGRDSNENQ